MIENLEVVIDEDLIRRGLANREWSSKCVGALALTKALKEHGYGVHKQMSWGTNTGTVLVDEFGARVKFKSCEKVENGDFTDIEPINLFSAFTKKKYQRMLNPSSWRKFLIRLGLAKGPDSLFKKIVFVPIYEGWQEDDK